MASRRQEEGQALKTGSYVCFSVPLSWSSTECKNCSGPEAQGQSQAQAVLPRDLQATKRGHGNRSSIGFGWFSSSFRISRSAFELEFFVPSILCATTHNRTFHLKPRALLQVFPWSRPWSFPLLLLKGACSCQKDVQGCVFRSPL